MKNSGELEAWTIDVNTINVIKAYGVSHVGVLVEDGRRYLAPITLFGPEGKDKGVVVLDYSKTKGAALGAKGKFGELQFYVPLKLFAAHIPPIEEREGALMERMRVVGSRL